MSMVVKCMLNLNSVMRDIISHNIPPLQFPRVRFDSGTFGNGSQFKVVRVTHHSPSDKISFPVRKHGHSNKKRNTIQKKTIISFRNDFVVDTFAQPFL